MTNIKLLEYFISVQLEFVSDIDSGPFWLKVYTAFVKGRCLHDWSISRRLQGQAISTAEVSVPT